MPFSPKISVVMSTYNDAAHLPASIDSVLGQDFTDFEFIIVNDGSSDPRTAEILADYAKRDERIRVITKQNEGLTKALIDGCAAARGEYIARQDSDDISLPGRLATQVSFLRCHLDVVLCTSGIRCVAPKGETIAIVVPQGSVSVQTRRLQKEMIGIPAHGCAMFRRSAYEKAGGYRWQFYYAQDCDLWLRLGRIGRLGSVPEILYELHESTTSISSCHRQAQHRFAQFARDCHQAAETGAEESSFMAGAAALRDAVISMQAVGGRRDQGRTGVSTTLRLVAVRLAAQGNVAAARRYLWQAVRVRPYDLRTWRDLARLTVRSAGHQ